MSNKIEEHCQLCLSTENETFQIYGTVRNSLEVNFILRQHFLFEVCLFFAVQQ